MMENWCAPRLAGGSIAEGGQSFESASIFMPTRATTALPCARLPAGTVTFQRLLNAVEVIDEAVRSPKEIRFAGWSKLLMRGRTSFGD